MQNDRITKLKIDNNPFAKGFRESGQSRCKRKLALSSSSSSIASDSSSTKSTASIKNSSSTNVQYENEIDVDTISKRKRSNSLTESVSSLDDSGLSVSESCSGTSSPVISTTPEDNRAYHEDNFANGQTEQFPPLMHQYPPQQSLPYSPQEIVFQQFRGCLPPPFMNLAFRYMTRGHYPPPSFYSPQMLDFPTSIYKSSPSPNQITHVPLYSAHMNMAAETQPPSDIEDSYCNRSRSSNSSSHSSLHSPNSEQCHRQEEVSTPSTTTQSHSSSVSVQQKPQQQQQQQQPPPKKCNFSISSILGCES